MSLYSLQEDAIKIITLFLYLRYLHEYPALSHTIADEPLSTTVADLVFVLYSTFT